MADKNSADTPEKVYYTVIAYIKQLMSEGKLAFGDKLPSERHLMATLGLSRNSVREAVRTLDNMGIVDSRAGSGNFLSDRMDESLAEILSFRIFANLGSDSELSRLRCAMEREAFLLAVGRAEIEDGTLSDMHLALTNMNCGDKAKEIDADSSFHFSLVKASGNRLMCTIMSALSSLCENEIGAVIRSVHGDAACEIADLHQRIYNALIAKDSAGVDYIEKHYAFIEKQLNIQ